MDEPSVVQVPVTDAGRSVPSNELIYHIETGVRDKFHIDVSTGLIYVELSVDLDQDVYGSMYRMRLLAINCGTLPNTATALCTIADNNQLPVFRYIQFEIFVFHGIQVILASYHKFIC